jgi:transcriptional regulator of arginine metabolism
MKNERDERLALIKQIIKEKRIENQAMLREELGKHGVHPTQATVSRDIRELNIVKVKDPEDDKSYYKIVVQVVATGDETFKQSIRDYVEHVERAGNIVVIHTLLANANALAAQLDERHFDGLMGTLAGTDTIVCFAKGEEQAEEFLQMILTYRGW